MARREALDVVFLGAPLLVWLAGGLALFMAWTIGANDVANAMGTSVGSGALTIRRAIVVAALLEFSGAFFVGGHVTDTVRKGILVDEAMAEHVDALALGMLAALASAATLLLGATRLGLPISTTHSIVGAIIGFGAAVMGVDAVEWGKVAEIALSWLSSPLIGGGLAFGLFLFTRWLILDREDPHAQVQRWGPLFYFAVLTVMALVTLFKGLKNLKLDFDLPEAIALSLGVGVLGALGGRLLLVRVRPGGVSTRGRFRDVERSFVLLQILTACSVAFAHGSNDVANAIGPLAAIIHSTAEPGYSQKAVVAPWMLLVGGAGIVVGLATWGYRVMETVGRRITELTPSRGFAAELAAAITIVVASRMGIPVSTTHVLVGSVLGVGFARGIDALDLRILGTILLSWLATLPIAALLSILFYHLFRILLGA